MSNIRAIGRVGLVSFITTIALYTGNGFAQSPQDDADESISATSSDLTSQAALPQAAVPTLTWTSPVQYDKGRQSTIAIRDGLIVEAHQTESSLHSGLYYHIGKLDRDSGTVKWGPSHLFVSSGDWPSVALSKEGYVIFTWSTGFYNCCSDLAYRVGTVNLAGDVNQTIDFQTGKETVYDSGYHNSISINSQGVIAEAHEGGKAMFYRLGHLKNPAGKDYNIVWDTGKNGIKYDSGVDPQISINDNYQVVEVHGVRSESLLHYIRGSALSNTIDFSSDHPRYDNRAVYPGVVLLSDGSVVEVHQSGSSAHYRTGELAANPAYITWSAGALIGPAGKIGLTPSVASDGIDVIATFTDYDKLNYAVAKLP
jgi:hypothetical protein